MDNPSGITEFIKCGWLCGSLFIKCRCGVGTVIAEFWWDIRCFSQIIWCGVKGSTLIFYPRRIEDEGAYTIDCSSRGGAIEILESVFVHLAEVLPNDVKL